MSCDIFPLVPQSDAAPAPRWGRAGPETAVLFGSYYFSILKVGFSARGTCTATRPSQASPKRAEHRPAPAQDLEAFKADMTSMLSDMLQSSLSKFASQFNPSSGGQGDSAPTQTMAFVPTMDVASDREDIPTGPEDQSGGK